MRCHRPYSTDEDTEAHKAAARRGHAGAGFRNQGRQLGGKLGVWTEEKWGVMQWVGGKGPKAVRLLRRRDSSSTSWKTLFGG